MGRNARNNTTFSATAATSTSGSKPGSRTNNPAANLPSAVTQTRYVAKKCMQDAFEDIQAVSMGVFSAAEQQVAEKSEVCKQAVVTASKVLDSHEKAYEGQNCALGQLDLVMKGLDVKIKLLDSKKLEQFCKHSSESLKTDLNKELGKV